MLGAKRAVFPRTLRRGDSGEDVRQLQELLHVAGFDPGPADGNFGPSTHAAVVAFQHSTGLSPDGAAGPRTMAALTQVSTQTGSAPGESATGLSLHIGLNQVDEAAYGFPVPDLAGCINDANDMQDVARGRGFRTRQLLNSAATSSAVIEGIQQAAQQLHAGDMFWISYSGHGSQVPDPLEEDKLSETWVLWERQLIDHELYALWSRFRPGVRILVISDSCHSGTVSRALRRLNAEVSRATEEADEATVREVPPAVVLANEAAVELALTLADTMTTVLQSAGVTRPGAARDLASRLIGQLTGSDDNADSHPATSADLSYICRSLRASPTGAAKAVITLPSLDVIDLPWSIA